MFKVPIRKVKKLVKKGFHVIGSVHYADGYSVAYVSKKCVKN